MTYPTHPLIRVTPYPGENADIIPLRPEEWTAAIRDGVLSVYDATRRTHRADPWWSLTEGPAILVEWCAIARTQTEEHE
jgi:hypothetical protein